MSLSLGVMISHSVLFQFPALPLPVIRKSFVFLIFISLESFTSAQAARAKAIVNSEGIRCSLKLIYRKSSGKIFPINLPIAIGITNQSVSYQRPLLPIFPMQVLIRFLIIDKFLLLTIPFKFTLQSPR